MASDDLDVMENLWHMSVRSYMDNSLPELFKEKVLTIFSKSCTLNYPLLYHSSQLYKLGVKAEEIIALIEFPILSFNELDKQAKLFSDNAFKVWPLENTNEENFILLCSVAIFEGSNRRQMLTLLKKCLQKSHFDALVLLESFARTYLNWYECHPEIADFSLSKKHDQIENFIDANPNLKKFFKTYQLIKGETAETAFERKDLQLSTMLNYFNKTPVAICIFEGSDYRIAMVNEQYRAYLPNEDAIGLPAAIAMPELSNQGLIKILDSVYTTGEPHHDREMAVNLGGGSDQTQRYFNVSFQPIFQNNNVHSILQVAIEVTTQIESEVELETSLAHFSQLADIMPQIVFKTDAQGKTYYLNTRWTDYSGSSNPKDWGQFVHPEDFNRVTALWKNSIMSGLPFEAEYRLKKTSGIYQWHLTRAVADRNSDGAVVGWIGTSTNIEDQKNLAQKIITTNKMLDSERQKFEVIFSEAPAAMAILKGSTLIFEKANSNYLKFLGDRDIIGKPILEAIPELIGQPFIEIINEVFKTGITFSAKESLMMLRGTDSSDEALSSKYFDITFQRMNGADTLPYGVFIFATDVSEKVLSRHNIQASEKEFRTLAEVMPQIIFVADVNGEITYLNEKWEQYTGYSFEQTKEWSWSPVHHPEDLDLVINIWNESLTTGKPYQVEYRLKGRDGLYRWFLGRALPIKDFDGKILKWIGTNTDIHDQKILSQKLESALDQVQYSQRLAESANEAKSAFLANMSHEIRTPLGAIMGFVSLMKNPALRKEDLQKYISITQRNSEQLLKIIDDILDLSKVEAGKLAIEKINLNLEELLTDFSSSMELRASENGIQFKLNAKNQLPLAVLSDPTRLKQILMNIVGNAIKFTHKGSVELTVDFEDSTLEFMVKDTGVGIRPEQAIQLFQPFSQGDTSISRKYGGTGLGLILTQRLCEAMGGKFHLKHSEVGVGSTFVASIKVGLLPDAKYFSKLKTNMEEETKKDFDKSTLAGVRILVIDDLEDNLTLINVILSEAGASVVTEADAFEGIRQAIERKFDVILMDIQMPLMNGYDVMKKIHRAGSTIPIIALTAHAMKDEREKAIKHGFSEFLAKPINSEILINTINKLHKQNLYVPPPTEKILVVEDDHDLRDLLEVLLTSKGLDVTLMETGEALLNYLATHQPPKLILVDLALPFMSGNELIPILNKRTDRSQYKVVIASGWDDLPSRAKILKADGYLKKPYNPQTIADSIKKLIPNETT